MTLGDVLDKFPKQSLEHRAAGIEADMVKLVFAEIPLPMLYVEANWALIADLPWFLSLWNFVKNGSTLNGVTFEALPDHMQQVLLDAQLNVVVVLEATSVSLNQLGNLL